MRKNWTEVSGEQLEAACIHMKVFDFPEPESALGRMGKKAGFANMDHFIRFGPHQVWEFGETKVNHQKSRLRKGKNELKCWYALDSSFMGRDFGWVGGGKLYG